MVQTISKISHKETAPAIGSYRPLPSGAVSSLEMDFEGLRWFIKRYEPLLWEDKELEMAIVLYRARPGKWEGQFESDDIWPFDIAKASRPFSDYQLQVLENLINRRKEFRLRVEESLKRHRI